MSNTDDEKCLTCAYWVQDPVIIGDGKCYYPGPKKEKVKFNHWCSKWEQVESNE